MLLTDCTAPGENLELNSRPLLLVQLNMFSFAFRYNICIENTFVSVIRSSFYYLYFLYCFSPATLAEEIQETLGFIPRYYGSGASNVIHSQTQKQGWTQN